MAIASSQGIRMSLHSGLDNGHIIDGHRIESVLEQDVLGTLYLATDLGVQRPVALRVVNPMLTQDPIFVQQFQLETSRLAQLSHPNIVTIYDIRDTNQATYISMEYVESVPMSAYLDQVQGPRWRLGVPLLQQAMEALDYAHGLGIFHESLKPERIRVTAEGRVKIMDFGVARMLKKVSLLPLSYNDSDIRGYPAPEHLGSPGQVDERSDVYSLGLILYEMLTGSLPFDKTAPDFVVRNTLNDALIQNPARLNPNVPRRLAQITMKALRKHPNDRYQSVRAMLQDIQLAEPSNRQPVRAPRRSRWRGEFRRMLNPVTAAYALAAVLFASGSLYAFKPQSDDPFQVLSLEGPKVARAETPRVLPPAAPAADSPPSTPPPASASATTPDFVAPNPNPPATVAFNPSTVVSTPTPPVIQPPNTTTPTLPAPGQPAPGETAVDHPPPPAPAAERPASQPTPPAATPAPAKPAAPRPRMGWLAITSSPSGAVVVINGKLSGKTPTNGAALPPGTASVAITLAGYDAITTEVDVTAGRTVAMTHTLKPRDGTIKLHIVPRGDIFLDDSLVVSRAEGLHTLMASPETHQLSIRHPAFGVWERAVVPRYDHVQFFVVDFTQAAAVDVTSFDENSVFVPAEIWVDGRPTGQFTPMTVQAPIGVRSLEVRAEGYQTSEPVRVNIEAGSQQLIEFRVQRADTVTVR